MAEATWVQGPLPVGEQGRNSVGWWGVLCLVATEGSLFVYLLFSYYYLAVQRGRAWLPDPHPSLALAGPNTLILLASSVAVWWGEEGVKRARRGQQLLGLFVAIALGAIFLVIQGFEWKSKTYSLSSSSYGSLYFTITGFHMAHVIVGLAILIALFAWSVMGCFNPRRYAAVSIGALYWHFVDVVWFCVFTTFYLSPYVS